VGSLLSYGHGFDNDLNLTNRTDNLNAANNRVFGYDEIHRLTAASGPWGPGAACTGGASYEYDENGNRLCKGEQALPVLPTMYTYGLNTNRLATAAGGEPAIYVHDNNGNLTEDGTFGYIYSQADRLVEVEDILGSPVASYTYDGDGRRVIKVAGGVTTYYFYDPAGTLLTETIASADTGKDYIYLADVPMARVDWTPAELSLGNVLRVAKPDSTNVRLDWTLFASPSGDEKYLVRRKQVVDPDDKSFDGSIVIAEVEDPAQTYDDPVLADGNRYDYQVHRRVFADALLFYHTDDLGTPIAMTGGGGNFEWRVEHFPFGGIHSMPVSTVANNLRFPGQYADAETGLYQNGWRDYAVHLGRYVEPDPGRSSFAIKEALYSYVANNPLAFEDRMGLSCGPCCDTAAKIAADHDRIRRAAARAVFRYGITHLHVPQTRCQTYTGVVEQALIDAKPKCHDFTDVYSKRQQLSAHALVPSIDVEPAHVATILRPCNARRWEDGFILDAWPLGNLAEFTWDEWRPGLTTYTPSVDPRLVYRGTCDGLLRP
jgi:RHS repeat-associated protein